MTPCHKLFEQNRQLNDAARPIGGNENLESFLNSNNEAHKYKNLYTMLVNKAVCTATTHPVLLELQSLDQTQGTMDMYLSCTPMEPIHKYKTSIKLHRYANCGCFLFDSLIIR